MTDACCSCGLFESGDEQLTDHLLEAFTPPDSRGNDGQIHEELASACACGFTAAAPGELDGHFLAAFTPADSVGLDGRKHAPQSGHSGRKTDAGSLPAGMLSDAAQRSHWPRGQHPAAPARLAGGRC